MKLRMLILILFLGSHLYAFPSQCYDAMSGYYNLQTGEEKPLKRDKLKSYFKQDGEKILVSGNQYNWFPLAMIANNEENIQLVESIKAGFVLYTYHKKIQKMVIQKSYNYPLIGSAIITLVYNKCIE